MKTISETIDGSIKDIIQLKTVDNSLEYSQMFDALEGCPDDFKTKLIGALNSLGETMGTDPCDAFNKVLCASDDENAKKKLYNWWKGVFEVVGKSEGNIPEDRVGEYEEKVDALVAEICKAGDKASDDNEVVLEDYEPADLEDEDKLKESMAFAISKLGEVANKAQELVNFLNPYCKAGKFNEDNNMKKLNERGGSDWVSMDDIVGMEVGEADDGSQFWKDMDKIDDLEKKGYWSGKFKVGDKVCWVDPETEEIISGCKVIVAPEVDDDGEIPEDGIYVIAKDDGSEAEVYGKELRPETVKESDVEPLDEDDFLNKMMDSDTDDVFDVYEGSVMVDGSVCLNVIVNKEDVEEEEVEAEFADYAAQFGWKYENFSFSSDLVGDEGTETINVYFRPIEKKVDESDLENELNAGDDGWKEIGQPVGEATVTVDANDVWDVLDLLDDETANKHLTDLINSHVRSEEEIMDAIDSCYPNGVRKGELNAYMNDSFYEIVSELGLDVEKFKRDGQFVEPEKPVTLEGSDDEQKPDEVKDGDKKYKKDGETKTLVTGSEKKVVTEMTIEQEVDDPWKLVNLLWGQGKENFQELLDSNLFGDDTIMSTLEQFEIRELGNLNDFLAFEFENFLEALGCDREAWVQNLEITRGGSEEVDEASKKKVAPKDPMIAKIEETIPVDAKDGLIEIRPDRFSSYLAVYAPGSEPEMVAATRALSKAFPDYYVGYDNNSVAIWPKKRV